MRARHSCGNPRYQRPDDQAAAHWALLWRLRSRYGLDVSATSNPQSIFLGGYPHACQRTCALAYEPAARQVRQHIIKTRHPIPRMDAHRNALRRTPRQQTGHTRDDGNAAPMGSPFPHLTGMRVTGRGATAMGLRMHRRSIGCGGVDSLTLAHVRRTDRPGFGRSHSAVTAWGSVALHGVAAACR